MILKVYCDSLPIPPFFNEFQHVQFMKRQILSLQAHSLYLKKYGFISNQWSSFVFLVCISEIPVVNPTAVVSSTEEPAG